MKSCLLAIAGALFLSAPVRAEKIVTLGDSLTFAYEAEFGFTINFFGTTYGDGFGSGVRNWAEILNNPLYRKPYFDLGERRNIRTSFPLPRQTLFFRHDSNWAIPGLTIDQLRRFIQGQAGFTDLLSENPGFSTFNLALNFTDFDEGDDFNLEDLETQVSSEASRLTFFIGGNDVRSIYGTVYDGGSAGTFIEDFIADANAILDRVRVLSPTIPIVLVNVPHIGITPDIQSDFPTDPLKTERVSALLRDLNGQLAAIATARGIGYADIFTPTIPLLSDPTFCLQGITFANTGSITGDLDFAWLNGPLSSNFHPNTNAQALIANEIIRAFNRRYKNGIAPLTATEMLGGLLGKSPAQIDMSFADWRAAHRLDSLAFGDDSEGDGLEAGIEFALGLDPRFRDADFVSSYVEDFNGTPALHLAFPKRLQLSSRFTLTPASSQNLSPPFTPVTSSAYPDGLFRAILPIEQGPGFLRLESRTTP